MQPLTSVRPSPSPEGPGQPTVSIYVQFDACYIVNVQNVLLYLAGSV